MVQKAHEQWARRRFLSPKLTKNLGFSFLTIIVTLEEITNTLLISYRVFTWRLTVTFCHGVVTAYLGFFPFPLMFLFLASLRHSHWLSTSYGVPNLSNRHQLSYSRHLRSG